MWHLQWSEWPAVLAHTWAFFGAELLAYASSQSHLSILLFGCQSGGQIADVSAA